MSLVEFGCLLTFKDAIVGNKGYSFLSSIAIRCLTVRVIVLIIVSDDNTM